MSYNYTDIDKSLTNWFKNDAQASSLTHITVRKGALRGVGPIEIPIDYPIVAIAGRNGTGKSTVLALAACAYHHTPIKFNPQRRPRPHYTFADFFAGVSGEPEVQGVQVWYQFFNTWAKKGSPKQSRLGWQVRKKEKGGRWSNYDTRVSRSVAFLGIQRVVPESEETVLRTYSKKFSQGAREQWEASVAASVGTVLGRTYTGLTFLKHGAHRLPLLETAKLQYSGFNMGAGESALIELFATIYACSEPLLVVIDEIELGLHDEAQARLIAELKQVSKSRKLQVICSTHSGTVLSALPPEARIFLERTGDRVTVLTGITPQYATGKLSGQKQPEIDILVEDEHAVSVVQAALTTELRNRVRIVPVGSHMAVMRHMATRATEKVSLRTCAILDGDRRSDVATSISNFMGGFELRPSELKSSRTEWLRARLYHLPGDSWPERWAIEALRSDAAAALDEDYGLEPERRQALYESACVAGKHNEFHAIATALSLPADLVRHRLVSCAFSSQPGEREAINKFVRDQLSAPVEWPA